jgi:uncharacterized protein YwqG
MPRSKVGGWPSWVQEPNWPHKSSDDWLFLGQLDYHLGVDAPWSAGGYAYLFLSRDPESRIGEILLQTT